MALDIFRDLPTPETVFDTPESLEQAGGDLLRRTRSKRNQASLGVKTGELAADDNQVPFVQWTRFMGESALVLTLLDRRAYSGGFGLVAVRAPIRGNRTDGNAYIFGDSGGVHGVREVFSGPISDTYFQDGSLRNLLMSRLDLPARIPLNKSEFVGVSKGLSTIDMPK